MVFSRLTKDTGAVHTGLVLKLPHHNGYFLWLCWWRRGCLGKWLYSNCSWLISSFFSTIRLVCTIGFLIKHCITYLFFSFVKTKCDKLMCSNESTISNQPECYCFTLRTSTPLLYIYYIGTECRRKPLLHTVSFKLYILALNFRLLLWHDYHWMKNSVVQTWLLLFPEVFFCTYLCSRLLNTYVFFHK